MIVYRAIEDVYSYVKDKKSRNELEDYKNFKISVPKKSYNHGINTHNYEFGVSYLHFFHFFEDAVGYIQSIPSIGWDGRSYIARYDIPEFLLEKYRGFGYYPEKYPYHIPVLEYAIPYSELNNRFVCNNLVNYCTQLGNRKMYSDEYKEYISGGIWILLRKY